MFFVVDNSLGANDALRFNQSRTGNNGLWDTPNGSITLGTWHHVVVTYDDGNTANDPAIYIDGQPQALTENAGAPSGTATSDAAGSLRLANRPFDTARTFDGLIDEVRLSNTIRSADWIEAGYLSQNGTFAFNTFGGANGGR